MLKYSLLLLAVAGLLLCHQFEAKKIKEKQPKQHAKPDEPVHHHHAPSANHEPHPHQEFVNHEANANNNQNINDEAVNEKDRLVKPKHLKVLSSYEKCKMECKKQRDQESAHEYVERLREELKLAEQHLAQRDDRVIEL